MRNSIRSKNFKDWCINFNNLGWLKYWDYEKNKSSPEDYKSHSTQDCYFLCPNSNSHSFSRKIQTITGFKKDYEPFCCNSLGSWLEGEENVQHLSFSLKNNVDPYMVGSQSNKKFLFVCDKHGEFEATPTNLHGSSAREPRGCPYCSHQKPHPSTCLANRFPLSLEYWSEKNINSPEDYLPISDGKVWWKCDNNIHEDYLRIIKGAVRSDFECPMCTLEKRWSRLQRKINSYLCEKGYRILHEQYCSFIPVNPKTNKNMFIDNEIWELKLFIEVHGRQHYKKGGFNQHIEDVESQQYRDALKKEQIIEAGYNFLEITYLDEINSKYKKIIDDKINEIKGGECCV